MINYTKEKMLDYDDCVVLFSNPIDVNSTIMKCILEELETKYTDIHFFIVEDYKFEQFSFIKEIPTIQIYKNKKLLCSLFGRVARNELENIFDNLISNKEESI